MQAKEISKVVLQQLLQRISHVAQKANEVGEDIRYGLPVGHEGYSALMREELREWLNEVVFTVDFPTKPPNNLRHVDKDLVLP